MLLIYLSNVMVVAYGFGFLRHESICVEKIAIPQ